MLKKYRQLVLGIIIGVMITGVVAFAGELRTFVAEEANFPVLVDGSPISLDMPVVTIEGRTYLPLRAMGDVLGISVEWNEEKGQAEVAKDTKQNEGDNLTKTNKYIPSDSILNNPNPIVIEEGNKYYISADYINDTAYSNGCSVDVDLNSKIMKILNDGVEQLEFTMIYIENKIRYYVPYDYYIDNILPLFPHKNISDIWGTFVE